jgi:hypothetical protein
MILINVLIMVFTIILMVQLFYTMYSSRSSIEGMTDTNSTENGDQYNSYDTKNGNNTLILEQQNAGNIEYLKKRVDVIDIIQRDVTDLSGNVTTLQDQVNGLMQAQEDYANQLTGGKPPEITGAVDEDDDEEDEDEDINS